MSNALRTALDYVAQDQQQRAVDIEAVDAQQMGALRRGYNAGRIGTDVNAALDDEASYRAQGREQEATAAAQRAAELQRRQAMYAPDVGRVEDIRGVGGALSWAGTQIGQGAASMQDPALIAAGGQAVGTVSRFIPGLRGVSKLAPLAGAIGAFGYNQRQNAGEMYGRLKDDPAAMANMTAQEARDTTNLYGVGAGALDTVLPALAGRALGGRALLRGNAAGKAVLGNVGPMGRTGLGMVAEGTTELGQQGLQQLTHSFVNPDRDTSGDFSENLNALAGGALSGAPFSAAGAYADAGYERVGTGAERVKEVAGQVVDMAAERGGQIAGKVREAAPDVYQRSGLKGVIDLGTEKGKSAWQKLAEGYRKVDAYARDTEGRVNFPEAMERARQDVERYRLSEDDYSAFTEMPDDALKGPELESWYAKTDQRRMNLAAERLEALEEQGVTEATELLDRITNQDPVVSSAAIPDAVEFLLSRNESALVRQKAVAFRALFGTAIQKATAAATSGARKGAEAAVKGAAFAAENVAEGVRQANSKKNMQGTFAQPAERIRPQDTSADFDKWAKWTMQNETGSAVAAAAAARWDPKAPAQAPDVTAQRKRQPVPPQVKERAVAHGEMLAAEIERTMTETDAELGLPDYARTLAYEINRTAFEAGTNPVSQNRMDRMVEDLVGLFGPDATQIVNRMAQTSSPVLRPFFQQITDRVTGWSAGRAQRRMRDRVMADQLIALLPVEQQREVRSDPKAGTDLLNMVGELTRGRVPPARRKQIEQALGAETVGRMLEVYNAETETLNADGVSLDIAQELGTMVDDTAAGREVAGDDVDMNDDGEVTGMTTERADTFDQRQAERKLSRNSGPRMYVFVGEGKQSVRSSDDSSTRKARNPFEPTKKIPPAAATKARAAALEMSLLTGDNKPVVPNARPRLLRADEDGADVKLADKVMELEKTLGVDRTPENFFRLAQKELKGPAMAKQRAALDRLQQAHAAGDPAAVARVEESMQRFFTDRAGEYVVNAVTAKQVMDELGMSPSQRVAIFRDYMFQTATRMQAKDREAAAKYRTLAQNANMMLLDGVQATDTAAAENADTPTNSGMGGARQQRRLTAGEARTVRRAMEKYFSEGYLVRAEQLSDRTPGTMAVGELLELARAGTNMREAARGRAAKSGAADGAVGASLRNEIEGQLLNFPQRQGVNLLNTKGENNDLAIPAQNLVAWVRANRREDDATSDKRRKPSEEKQFLTDLMEGISTLASMDLIDGLPYVLGPDGDKQPFTNSVMERLDTRTLESAKQLEGMGLPPALALPNRTGKMANSAKRDRVATAKDNSQAKAKAGAFVGPTGNKEAARDAELAQTPDWFVADPLEGLVDEVRYITRGGKHEADLRVATEDENPASRKRAYAERRGLTAPVNKGANSDSDTVTPLDTDLVDNAEFEDQKRRSVDLTKGKSRESSIDAVKMAEQRGAQVVAYKNQTEVRDGQGQLQRVDRELDVAKTIANVEARLEAARGEGKDAGMAAGKHYAYPLAHALSVRNLQDLLDSGAFSAEQQQRLIDAQMEVAAILSQEGAGRVPAGPRLRLAKALADGFAEVENYAEADALLKRLGAQSPVKPKPKTKAAKADAAPAGAFTNKQVAMAIADEDYSAIKTDDDADAFISAMVRTRKQLDAMSRQYERDGKDMAPGPDRARIRLAEILDGKGKFAEFDLASLYPSWKMDSEPFADRIQKALRNAAAPEVAAQGPKSQPSPAGAKLAAKSAEGRKYNLQGTRQAVFIAESSDGWVVRDDLTGELLYFEGEGVDELTGAAASRETLVNLVAEAGDAFALVDDAQGKLNAQATTGQPASDAQIAQAKAYLDRVLGTQIKSEFAAITGFSGEWIEAQNLLRVSTLTNAGIMDVARHEALHAFFSKFVKANPKAAKVFASLTDDPRIVKRLEILLKDEPAALKQLTDGEERLAYIYQFAMAGRLRLPSSQGKTLLGKVRKFLRRVFQMVSDQERAADLLYAFEAGKMRDPSAAGKAIAKTINRGAWAKRGALGMDKIAQKAAALIQPASEILAKSASPTARKIGELFYTNPGEAKDGEREPGYLNDRNQNMRRFENVYREMIDGLNPEQSKELITAMQRETPTDEIADPEVAQAKEKLHKFFERMHRYMTDEKGLRINEIGSNYFPRVYDTDKLMNDPTKFTGMLLGKYRPQLESMADSWNEAMDKYYGEMEPSVAAKAPPKKKYTPETVAEAIARRLVGADGVDDGVLNAPEREDGVLRPWMSAGEKRKLAFIEPEDLEPFLEKDLTMTLSRYVRQAVRTAEYSARFGRQGARLHRMLLQAEKELIAESKAMLKAGDFKDDKARADWARRQYRDVANAAGAMEGSLGNDIKPIVRQLNSWGVVYQNVRLLPLALFSSFVDPLGIIARGGEMRHAYNAFVRGIKGIGQQWGDMLRDEPSGRKKDHWERLAEIAGVVDSATFSHLLADEYGSVYHTGTTRKINEVMFKANGMEAWNRAMRVGATEAAVNFITRHAKGETKDSARWMKELGLDEGDLHYTAEGDLITDKRVLMAEKPDMSLEEAELAVAKLHSSILRWVEGAILSPNAAQRPAWASDPSYGVFWHLKQFAYSFHETIMRRAVNEAKQGNAMPLGVFAWYIPVMIASDVVKGLATGMGDLPNYMQGYDVGDWVQHGVDRSGVLGKYHLLIDGIQDPLGVPGPMFDQVIDIITEPVEKTFIDALPAHAVYERMI